MYDQKLHNKISKKNVCSINEKVAGYMYAFSAKYNIKKIRKRKRILHKTIRGPFTQPEITTM